MPPRDQPPPPRAPASPGRLLVVGTGIQVGGHLTASARRAIEAADRVLYAVADPVTEDWLRGLRADAVALPYAEGVQRRADAYTRMADRVVEAASQGGNTCAVFYGHPGIFADPAHLAVRRARARGLSARMLPAVSSLDCLFADLDLDPARAGCQVWEAGDFVRERRQFDPRGALVLWQIALVDNRGFYDPADDAGVRAGLRRLTDALLAHHGPDHEVVVYEAAVYPTAAASIARMPLAALPEAAVSDLSTLLVPGAAGPPSPLPAAAGPVPHPESP